MERNRDITYTFSKRKADGSDVVNLGSSSESVQDRLSTASSQASLISFLDPDCNGNFEPFSVYPLSKQASKSLQQLISKSIPSELEKIISALKPTISDLMVDMYGNYLCQTLFHTCSAEQRLTLLQALRGSLVSIAFHPRGTHALQNLITMANLKEEDTIYREQFTGKIIDMSKDPNASHVVQRLLVSVSNRYFITREILGHIKDLATDKLGVCVVKKCCNDPEIMNEILEHALLLMQHPYGNYAVQGILELWKEEISYEFISCIQGRVTQLCVQKYASNVMEKALKIENVVGLVFKEMLAEDKIKEVVSSQYGCYVLRTLSLASRHQNREPLLEIIKKATDNVFNPKLRPLWQEVIKNLSSSFY